MTSEEIADMGRMLDLAFSIAGIEARVAEQSGGNVVGHHRINGAQVVGHLLARQVKLVAREVPATSTAPHPGRATISQACRILEFPKRGER